MMTNSLNISSYLITHGPALTSDIAAHFRSSGVSNEAARQRVSRLPKGVMVLRGISFSKRARFVYLERQFGTIKYWDALLKAIETANPAYAAAIAGVRAKGGIVTRSDFNVVCGSPLLQKKQVGSQIVLDRLCAISLLKKIEVQGLGECITLVGAVAIDTIAEMRARNMTETVLLGAIRSWAGRMNLASPQATTIRGEAEPQFSTFRFDLCGPCYLQPIRRIAESGATPGFFVADVIVGSTLDEKSVAPFLRKCRMLSHLKSIRPFLPMFIADSFTPEALRACRAAGIITTTPTTLFGQDVGRALNELLETLGRAATIAAVSPEKIERLFDRLGTIEGAATHLRGALFELVVGHMVRSIEGGSIDIGTIVHDSSGRSAEIDVRLVKERLTAFYECKGYQPGSFVGEKEVEDWIRRQIPVIRDAHGYRGGENFRFEFWTCGRFTDDALKYLQAAAAATEKYVIAWKDGSEVRAYADQIKSPGIRKIINEHYFGQLASLEIATPKELKAK